MKSSVVFWTHTLAWATGLAGVFTFLSFLGGGGAEAIAHLPGWIGLGLALGTYPAGVRVSSLVLPDGARDHRALFQMTLNLLAASVMFLGLVGYVGPAVQSSFTGSSGGDMTTDARTMTLGELRPAIRAARAIADPDGDLEPSTIRAWFPVNVLAWNYFARLSGAVLPFLFGWIGVMAGFWARATSRAEVRAVQLLVLGLLLLVSTYLANENSFEWIVIQAAGPVPFAGVFSLVVPSLLALGLAWPTVATVTRLPAR